MRLRRLERLLKAGSIWLRCWAMRPLPLHIRTGCQAATSVRVMLR